MNFYPLLKPLLFSLDPELAHRLTLDLLSLSHQLKLTQKLYPPADGKAVKVMGLTFNNPVGLAAGLDKNGDYLDALADLGFGFLELGTVTPRPQPGNPKPRLFRLPAQQAIINRMGFNNLGVEHLLKQIGRSRYRGILGINIGKNFDTPNKQALDDYLLGLRKVYAAASYVTINISSPNTKNLRQLQQGDQLKKLLSALKEEQRRLTGEHGKYVPLVLKIAPDLTSDDLGRIAGLLLEFAVDAVIAGNTTIQRTMLADHPLAKEPGGLSGAPLKTLATEVVRQLAAELNGKCPIIAAGGIMSAQDAQEKIQAGAQLVQLYSGLIFQGPGLVKEIITNL